MENYIVYLSAFVLLCYCSQESDACADIHKGCELLAKRGMCLKREAFMTKACPKSCDLCHDEIAEKEIKDINAIELLKEKRDGVCKDEIKSCHVLKAKKMCNHLVMEKKCRKTCNFCGPNCADKQKACPRMKKLGYCESKKDLMDKICQSTCGRCSDSSVSPNEGPEAYSANSVMSQFKSNKASTCKNKLADARCEYYAHVGWCGKNAQITEKCHRTCVCEYKKPVESKAPQSCNDSKYGCCSDKVTLKGDSDGTNCPGCKNDPRFEVLCGRFGDDCNSDGHLGISLRKYCLKTCQLC